MINTLAILLPILPLISIPLYLTTKNIKLHHIANVTLNAILFVITILIAKQIITTNLMINSLTTYAIINPATHTYIDPLNTLLLLITTFLNLVISIYAVKYLNNDILMHKITPTRIRLYYLLTNIFTFTMLLALTTSNLGILWIAIEATTLSSAFLVGFYNNSKSVEAAWKYIIICSVGIALAFVGIILLHLSSLNALDESQYLNIPALIQNAQKLDTQTLRLAFIFILIGFGTKSDLAPMHTWLPAAYSQAPAPISASLAGVLINAAFYPIIRTTTILNLNSPTISYTKTPLMILAFISIIIATYLILNQRQYKSLLAYSSIEHMGIITLAFSMFTPLAVYGALIHIINHSLTKTMLFLTTGNITQTYQSGEIKDVRALIRTTPFTGIIFLLSLFAIAGTPPFSIFMSEFTIITAIFANGQIIIGAILAILLAIIFASIIYTVTPMMYGTKDDTLQVSNLTNNYGNLIILALFIIILISAFFTPNALLQLINLAVNVIIS